MVMPITNIPQTPVTSGVVIFTGGINESVTNLELKEGELLECSNYFELDGPYHGYTSLPGYEVYDGTVAPSAVDLIIDPETGDIDDTDREQRRTEITPVPGQSRVRGVHVYEAEVYAVRDGVTGGKGVFVATDTGWETINPPELNPGGECDWTNALFPAFPVGAFVNTFSFFMADGVSRPIAYNKNTSVCQYIDDENLPSNQAGPSFPQYPTHVAAFDNRLWLAFPGGQLFYSELGDPSAWSGELGAGQIPTGDEITDLIVAPGNVLVVFMRNSTKVVYVAERPDADFGYQLKEFSQRSGALFNSSDRLLGDVYYVDDRGPTSMKTSDQFGDFSANSITKKVQRTFLEKKNQFSASVVQRELNQWRIFFNDGFGMCFTFHNKKIKGTGYFTYPDSVLCVTEGEDASGRIQMYFGSDDGFVYHMDSGTSLNGALINTYLVSSYHHYRSPRAWKRFLRLIFEMSAQKGTKFFIRTDYDYKSIDSPKNTEQSPEIVGFGGVWGIDKWSEFIYGDTYVQNPTVYIQGNGVNMSVIIRTSEKYKVPHVIHNVIADYQRLGHKM